MSHQNMTKLSLQKMTGSLSEKKQVANEVTLFCSRSQVCLFVIELFVARKMCNDF